MQGLGLQVTRAKRRRKKSSAFFVYIYIVIGELSVCRNVSKRKEYASTQLSLERNKKKHQQMKWSFLLKKRSTNAV